MYQKIRLLSDMSYSIGLIGLSEYIERLQIADWLEDTEDRLPDPRSPSDAQFEDNQNDHQLEKNDSEGEIASSKEKSSDERQPPWLKFLLFNKWMFTVGDRDCYPSVPHGHLHKKTNKWPKLNPYTGRAFSDMHKENDKLRLSKSEMKFVWNNPDFVEHCRTQVLWYSDFAPEYNFPRARFGKLVFPKWR
jgi:hypothetical protein